MSADSKILVRMALTPDDLLKQATPYSYSGGEAHIKLYFETMLRQAQPLVVWRAATDREEDETLAMDPALVSYGLTLAQRKVMENSGLPRGFTKAVECCIREPTLKPGSREYTGCLVVCRLPMVDAAARSQKPTSVESVEFIENAALLGVRVVGHPKADNSDRVLGFRELLIALGMPRTDELRDPRRKVFKVPYADWGLVRNDDGNYELSRGAAVDKILNRSVTSLAAAEKAALIGASTPGNLQLANLTRMMKQTVTETLPDYLSVRVNAGGTDHDVAAALPKLLVAYREQLGHSKRFSYRQLNEYLRLMTVLSAPGMVDRHIAKLKKPGRRGERAIDSAQATWYREWLAVELKYWRRRRKPPAAKAP